VVWCPSCQSRLRADGVREYRGALGAPLGPQPARAMGPGHELASGSSISTRRGPELSLRFTLLVGSGWIRLAHNARFELG